VTDAAARDHARAWSFDELVREGGSLIPAYAPQWTNHNPSDPGITLLELLAYFSEILAYRALRITPDAKLHFLRLLEGRVASPSDALIGVPSSVIDEAIRTRVEGLSRVECAVTPGDFERLAVDAAATYLDGRPGLRARCVPGLDLRRVVETQHPAAADATADVSIVLALEPELPSDVADGLCRHVHEALAPRCLLTTRAHVVRAPHLHVSVGCRISPEPGVPRSVAAEAVDATLRRRFDPMQSGEPLPDTRPFGRPLHLATVAAEIDRTEGVDYVENVIVLRMSIDGAIGDDESLVGIRIGVVARLGENTRLGGLASVGMRRLQTDHTGEAETVLVQPWELVHVQLAHNGVQGIGDVGFAFSAGGPRGG
jgi:hypothetical protein